MLCAVCITALHIRAGSKKPSALVVGRDHWGTKPIMHHPDPASFQKSVELGCYICKTFYREHRQSLSADEYGHIQQGVSSYTVVSPYNSFGGRWGINMRINTGEKSWFASSAPQSIFELFIVQDESPGLFQAVKGERMYKTADIRPLGNLPNAGLDLARAWIQRCRQEHTTCIQNFPMTEFLPTRLIDVHHGKHQDEWKLCHTVTDCQIDPYITLSHCWGSAQTLRLTTENLVSFRAGMRDSCLPLKYKDAFNVARSLGFRYIWIDSLCIIQDSQEDWLRESMTMHDIYRNSVCTLAASNATNSNEHFLKQRSPSVTLAEIIQMNWVEEPKGKISFLSSTRRSGDNRYLINHHDFFRMSLAQSTLARRAWCFQELALSPRVLHFEEDQLFWECRMLKSC